MSKLHYDGEKHQVSLISKDGKTLGTWTAYNNVDSHATVKSHLPNGSYQVQDKTAPHRHAADPNGPYGSYGIIRFDVPNHSGIGLHSGRANAKHLPGPQHPTMGCIRTSDEAMLAIKDAIASDPLTVMEVAGNRQAQAHYGHHLHGHKAHVHP
ncbi:L,D-transpeptidase [Dyella flagellata]|uniref:L,D-TPase catalytic domain-containing protein n=1 Tax=Dyella flagellata TaxID=1867833 RepID=A0ABQ5XDB5_9GAMM|nr:L,D-transpeptidase [Dyella flagellata]GLQ88967.1 hypothetical protein GCM10007898_25380 [Dyella flagellata]